MARKRLPAAEARHAWLHVRLRSDELRELKALAGDLKISVSRFARDLLLAARPVRRKRA